MQKLRHLAISLLLAVMWTACGNKDSVADKDASRQNDKGIKSTIGSEGGTVEGPSGAILTVPAGALEVETDLTIHLAEKAPELDEALTVISETWVIGPSGTVFAKPVELSIPYDDAKVPAGVTSVNLTVLTAPTPNGPWSSLETTVQDGMLVAQVVHLSEFVGAAGCRTPGQGCVANNQCCDGYACTENRCTACIEPGQSCEGNEFGCCQPYFCDQGTCQPCRQASEPCTDTFDCCDMTNGACVDGICTGCVKTGGACVKAVDCCNSEEKCVDGQCSAECGDVGQQCGWNPDCCATASGPPFCHSGTCSDCLPEGAECTLLEPCCAGMHCGVLPFACKPCKALGSDCTDGMECCDFVCLGGKCVACTANASVCKDDEDCCSGKCVDHVCQACSGDDEGCETVDDCCLGAGLQCINHHCTQCADEGQACGAAGGGRPCCNPDHICNAIDSKCTPCQESGPCLTDNLCCGDLFCLDESCQPCREEGPCESDKYCCTGFMCEEKQCVPCGDYGDECSEEKPCCQALCRLDGICGQCSPENGACLGDEDCCSDLVCEDKKCLPNCIPAGEPCSDEMPCCEKGNCYKDICFPECSYDGLPCQDGVCCEGAVCVQDLCHECANTGDDCQGQWHCCAQPGLECDEETMKCKKPDPGGGCNCDDAGVTFVVVKEPSAGYCGFADDVAMQGFCKYAGGAGPHESGTIISDGECELQIFCP